MPAQGWLWVDEIEVLNNSRTLANLECVNQGVHFTTFADPCPGFSRDPFSTPQWNALDYSAITAAPWYDVLIPYSVEFLGFHVETFTFNSPIRRSADERGIVKGGANISRLTRTHREMEFEVMLLATTDSGLQYGFDWLAAQLAPTDPCDTQTALMRLACPGVGSGNEFEDLWELREVGVLDGPEWGDSPFNHAGCAARRASFTLAAGDPCRHYTVETALIDATNALDTDGDCATASTQVDFICPSEGLHRQRECTIVTAATDIGQIDLDAIVEAGIDGAAATLVQSATNELGSFLDGLDGTAGNFAFATTTNLNTTASFLTIACFVKADDWTPAAEMMACGYASGADTDCGLVVDTSGNLKFYARQSDLTLRSGVSTQPVNLADGAARWIVCVVNVVAATVSFYTTNDGYEVLPLTSGGLTLIPLGTLDQAVTSWDSTFDTSTNPVIGTGNTASGMWIGEIYKAAMILDNTDIVANTDLTDETPGATGWTDESSIVWACLGACDIGALDDIYLCGDPGLEVTAQAIICRLAANEKVWIDSNDRRVWYDSGDGVWVDGTDQLSLVGQTLDHFFHFYNTIPEGLLWMEPATLQGHSTTATYKVNSNTRVCS